MAKTLLSLTEFIHDSNAHYSGGQYLVVIYFSLRMLRVKNIYIINEIFFILSVSIIVSF